MSNVFNLDAPIVPGKSAAGVFIGDSIENILLQVKPFTITDWSQGKRYQFGSVNLWVNNEGKIKQIGLYSGYTGKIAKLIGIGSKITDVIASLGVVVEDEEDNLIVQGLPGWCFESSEWRSPQYTMPDPSASIIEIFIFEDDKQRVGNFQYPTKCPQCGREMQFDLILSDRRGVNSSRVSPLSSEVDVLGYGFFCDYCQRGWTGDELLKMAKDRGLP
ncbi:MAG: hypothetical protein KJ069_30735 [Anaerolineae bacterium]|nr:hypothetical protein [Anaerolineae bacterium]